MAEFRLRIFTSPWHATLERVSRLPTLEDREPETLPLPLEFFSPLELVSFLEQNNTVRRGLR